MFKQVIVVREDLGLSTGKTAAQAAHASLLSYKKAGKLAIIPWELEGMKKVVLACKDLEELKDLEKKARSQKLPCALVVDAGLTEIPAGTITCLGIGPAKEETIDKVTGHLKILK